MAEKAGVPVFITEKKTSEFTSELIRWLNVQLAPCISIHGVLVDVYGVGVLIMGESGIGEARGCVGADQKRSPSCQRRCGGNPESAMRHWWEQRRILLVTSLNFEALELWM